MGTGISHHRCERRLADLKRIAPQVITVQLEQVEGVQEHAGVDPVLRMSSNDAMPLSSHATASPSIMQERDRSLASASTISWNWRVRSLPGRL
jgi:hypothetical protein